MNSLQGQVFNHLSIAGLHDLGCYAKQFVHGYSSHASMAPSQVQLVQCSALHDVLMCKQFVVTQCMHDCIDTLIARIQSSGINTLHLLRRCGERTHVNTCANKSPVQALESFPSIVMSPHLLLCQTQYLPWQKFEVSWLSKCIHGQSKIGCNTSRAMYIATTALLLSQNGLRSNLTASNFPGEACPRTPQSCMLLHAYIQI